MLPKILFVIDDFMFVFVFFFSFGFSTANAIFSKILNDSLVFFSFINFYDFLTIDYLIIIMLFFLLFTLYWNAMDGNWTHNKFST